MMDSSKKSSEKSAEKYECEPCKFDGDNISGEFWCLECQEYLCYECKKIHKRYKSFRNHNLVAACDASNQNSKMAAAEVEEQYSEHKEERLKDRNDEMTEGMTQKSDVEQFCDKLKETKSKAEIVSSRKRQNAASNDNEHTTILGKADDVIKTAKAKIDKCHEEFKDKLSYQYKKQTAKPLETEGLEQIDEFEQFSDKKKGIESETEMDTSRKRGNTTRIQNQQTINLGNADDVIQEAKGKLDKSYEKFKDKVSYHHKELTTKLLDTADKIDSIQNDITDYQKIWSGIAETGFKPIFTLQRITERVENHRKELEEYVKEDWGISLDTEISIRELKNIASQYSYEIEAKLSFFENTFSLDMDDLSNAGNANTNVRMNAPHIDDLEPVKVWKGIGGGSCSGGIFLNDGRLLLVNLNKTLNVYSDNGKREICHPVSYKPFDAAHDLDDNIYISSYSDEYIRVYKLMPLLNTLQKVKKIETDISPIGIYAIGITTDNHILAASSQCIYVMTMEGKTRRTIILSNCNICIATSTLDTGSVFYYCDDNDVVCQSITGEELLRYNIPGIEGACGVDLDIWGNIYVCGMLSENVCVVPKDGKSIRVFLSKIKGVCNLKKIGFDKSGSKFFVTDWINGNTAVFKLNVKK